MATRKIKATCGGAAVAEVNGIATSGKEAFVRVGSTIEIYPAANEGYTYNGGFVNGSYQSVDDLPLRYTVSDADVTVSGDKKNPSSQWYTGDVTMKPDTGYKIRKEGESQWKNELVITDEGSTSVTYRLTDSNGNITETRTKDICIDRLSPSGEISVGSAIDKIYYHKSSAKLTSDEVVALAEEQCYIHFHRRTGIG